MKVLVADDSRSISQLLCSYIESMGHQVVYAADGAEAIEQYRKHSPDLVLLDVAMPVVDGYEAAKTLRKQYADDWVPIIFISARIADDDIARGIAAGGDDYLTKPVSEVVLEAKIQAMQRIANMRQKLLQTSAQLAQANQDLERISYMDGLTNLSNRRHFDIVAAKEWRSARRRQHPISIMLADVDHFKRYNDHYGHQQGDQCLINVARILNDNSPQDSHILARYGGEEFILLLPNYSEEDCCRIAGQMCKAVNQAALEHVASQTSNHVTISAGCATMHPSSGNSLDELIRLADDALYEAKKQGRNRVFMPHQECA